MDGLKPYRWTITGVEADLVRQIRISAIIHGMKDYELVNMILRAYLDRYPNATEVARADRNSLAIEKEQT